MDLGNTRKKIYVTKKVDFNSMATPSNSYSMLGALRQSAALASPPMIKVAPIAALDSLSAIRKVVHLFSVCLKESLLIERKNK